MKKTIAWLYALFLGFGCIAVYADELRTENGDRIFGSSLQLKGGVIFVNSALGRIEIRQDKVVMFKTDKPAQITLSYQVSITLSGSRQLSWPVFHRINILELEPISVPLFTETNLLKIS